jgi:sugar transferase (PEP-CTERM system associated)
MWRYLAFRKFGAVTAESVLLLFCSLASYCFRYNAPFNAFENRYFLLKAVLIAVVFQVCLHLNDLYDLQATRTGRQFVIRLCQAILLASAILATAQYFIPDLMVGREVLKYTLILSSIFVLLWHTALRFYLRSRTPHTNLLVLGTGPLARELVREVLRHPELGIKVVGFVGDSPQLVGVSIVNPKVVGIYQELPQLVASNNVDAIIVELQDRRGKLPIRELLDFKTQGIAVEDATTFYERVAGKIPIENLKPSWMVFNSGFSVSQNLLFWKRAVSILASSIILLLFSPALLLVMIAIRLDSKGPIFFRQERVGQNGRSFTLWKFRSMYVNAERDSGPVWSAGAADKRVTRVGKFMRRTRLDELPQLFNVLAGDMSMVGPRPERPHFVQQLAETIPFYQLRHVVKPGLTGWAQINYGYANSFEHTVEKLQYDLFYIKNMSCILDAMILFETIKTVLVRKGS